MSRNSASVQSIFSLHLSHLIWYLHILALLCSLDPNFLTDSPSSCFMLYNCTRVSITFSSRIASFLMPFSISSMVLLMRVPPFDRVRFLRRSSSQHSSSWAALCVPETPVATMYSSHRVVKYSQSSVVPPALMVGSFTFLGLGAAWAPLVWTVV